MENDNVMEVDFTKVESEKNESPIEITQEMILGRLDGMIQNHLHGVREIVQDENFIKINEQYELNLIGIVSVFVTQIANQVGVNIKKEGILEKSQEFIEGLSVEHDMHPADVTAMLLKVFSDILLQVVAAEELGQEASK